MEQSSSALFIHSCGKCILLTLIIHFELLWVVQIQNHFWRASKVKYIRTTSEEKHITLDKMGIKGELE